MSNPPVPLDPLMLSDAGPPNITPANNFVAEAWSGALLRASNVIGFNSSTGVLTIPKGTYQWLIGIAPGYALATAATWHVLMSNSLGLGYRQIRAFDNSIAGDPFDKFFTFGDIFTTGVALTTSVNIACTTANQPSGINFSIVQLAAT